MKKARTRAAIGLVTAAMVAMIAIVTTGAFGAGSSTTAAIQQAPGVVFTGGEPYVKTGTKVPLRVSTSDASVRCVVVRHNGTDVMQTSAGVKGTWDFELTAPGTEGLQGIDVKSGTVTGSGGCNNNGGGASESYFVDNTGPVVTGRLDPAANAAGWNNTDTTVIWSASDAGSGVGAFGGPTPITETVDGEFFDGVKTATARDRLGNQATGSLTVRVDKKAPSIDATRAPAPNANGWNNSAVTFNITCADGTPGSGIASCTGDGTKVFGDEGENQTAQATAVDRAGNEKSTQLGPVSIDATDPTLVGEPTTEPNGDGWYKAPVTIDWTASDGLSGIDGAAPQDSTITGEGAGLVATATVRDRAGNDVTAQSRKVNIDTTAPLTVADAADKWNNVAVTVNLSASDNGSGVKTTTYQLDGGDEQTGSSVEIADEGEHTLKFWSADRAGNVEDAKTVRVKIDKTNPTITHRFLEAAEDTIAGEHNGWFDRDVRIDFECADDAAGIASCGPDRDITTEGQNQDVSGTAVDNAGNTATDPATASIDKTAPSITGAASPDANDAGWRSSDVTVAFTCADALSGIETCPAPVTVGEGANQEAQGTAKDNAGNTRTATVGDIDVDKTRPALTGTPDREPNEHGWYDEDVTVDWTCEDALSGLAGSCPEPSTVTGEAANLSASASIADKAGNERTATVSPIRIDRTAPVTTAEVPAPLPSTWYAGPVTVKLEAEDSLSGVAATYYRVDDETEKHRYEGPFEFSEKGVHDITFFSVDKAGNPEDAGAPENVVRLKIDGIAPTITGARTPAANGHGWNNAPVTVTFDCADGESGVAGCTDPVTLSNEGADQFAEGSAVDNAGNTAAAKVDGINIDTTRPTLSGAPTTPSDNAAGWYRGDVTVAWTAQDGLSGIADADKPADNVVTGEGENLSATASVSDRAGNVTDSRVDGLKIDRTAPAIDGAPRRVPDQSGWYRSAVAVDFTCTDNLSGVASCPSSEVVSANGAGQSVTSATATDIAGNRTATGKTVGGIDVDGLAPQSVAAAECGTADKWCTGESTKVVLSATDQDGLSGVHHLEYRVNGGEAKVVEGAQAEVTVPLDQVGEADVRFRAVDVAGNEEQANAISLKYDNVEPTVTHAVSPQPNAADWNRSDATVTFSATDQLNGSGVDEDTLTKPVLVDQETAGRLVEGSARDKAGNLGTDSVTVKLDETAPRITGAVVAGDRGEGDWYVGPVTVRFTCADDLSGVAVCPEDVVLTGNGAGQSVTRTATDAAGNDAAVTVEGIDIDSEKPRIQLKGIAPSELYTLGAVPTPSCVATDEVSGPAGCDVTVTGGTANGVGTFAYTARATDTAGNVTTETGAYRVVYRWDGFRQPINDTAHQTGVATSIFKAGSTVPVKFQLKRADGTVVQANAAPVWQVPDKGGPTLAPVDESLYETSADTSTVYRWDATDEQYHYNWKTADAAKGYYHRIGVRLDDGQVYHVNIGLR